MKTDDQGGFSFRWGIPVLDGDGFTTIPNFMLATYAAIPWGKPDGKGGVIAGMGISDAEMMFIIHLASYRFERPGTVARPALTTTLKARMGYATNQGIINVQKSLEEKGLLRVERRPGFASVFDFGGFSRACWAEFSARQEPDTQIPAVSVIPPIVPPVIPPDMAPAVPPAIPMGMPPADDPSTKIDDHPSIFVDDHPSTKIDGKKRIQEENTRRKDPSGAIAPVGTAPKAGKAQADLAPVSPASKILFALLTEVYEARNRKAPAGFKNAIQRDDFEAAAAALSLADLELCIRRKIGQGDFAISSIVVSAQRWAINKSNKGKGKGKGHASTRKPNQPSELTQHDLDWWNGGQPAAEAP